MTVKVTVAPYLVGPVFERRGSIYRRAEERLTRLIYETSSASESKLRAFRLIPFEVINPANVRKGFEYETEPHAHGGLRVDAIAGLLVPRALQMQDDELRDALAECGFMVYRQVVEQLEGVRSSEPAVLSPGTPFVGLLDSAVGKWVPDQLGTAAERPELSVRVKGVTESAWWKHYVPLIVEECDRLRIEPEDMSWTCPTREGEVICVGKGRALKSLRASLTKLLSSVDAVFKGP